MKIGRNDPCPCGSGKKYKHCCYAVDSVKHEAPVLEADAEEDLPTNEESKAEEGHAAPAPVDGKRDQSHGRGRFHGSPRGGTGSFSPRVFRGSQRGS